MNNEFASDVLEGLTATQKHLSSKYFYNQRGDELFQQIMELDAYYLTRAEYEILETYQQEIHALCADGGKFRLIELGAGDGLKTKILLRHFLAQGSEFEYVPVDISSNVLESLETSLKQEFPTLNISPVCGDYFKVLGDLKEDHEEKSVVLFLGSNIGNFSEVDRNAFLSSMGANLKKEDVVLIGFDLKKDPQVIRDAYDDKEGVTRAFNLNVLQRMNDELGADFDLNKFIHYPTYNPVSGKAESHLLSTSKQSVSFSKMNMTITFEEWEPIHLEISRKFSPKELREMADKHSFRTVNHLSDKGNNFIDVLWQLQ
jgi:dimethylhistidine N-methyltransferase